jgi:hypothetical protein
MASSCLLPRLQFSDLLITDCCDSVSEEEERCELSATYRIRQKIKMALIDQQSKRVNGSQQSFTAIGLWVMAPAFCPLASALIIGGSWLKMRTCQRQLLQSGAGRYGQEEPRRLTERLFG